MAPWRFEYHYYIATVQAENSLAPSNASSNCRVSDDYLLLNRRPLLVGRQVLLACGVRLPVAAKACAVWYA
jgi:hypothetical protein